MQAVGIAGGIEFDGHTVVLTRRNIALADDRRSIAMSSISAIDYRPASIAEGGYIRLIANGSQPGKFLALDKNVIAFRPEEQEPFIDVYCAIHEALHGKRPPDESLRYQLPAWAILTIVLCIVAFGAFWIWIIFRS